MDDCNDTSSYSSGLCDSSSYIISSKRVKVPISNEDDNRSSHPWGTQQKNSARRGDGVSQLSFQVSAQASRATGTNVLKKVGESQKYTPVQPKNVVSTEPYCHVKTDSVIKLKDSTRKLLYLLEDIQMKANAKHLDRDLPRTVKAIEAAEPSKDVISSVTDVCATALKRLENQTKILSTIKTEDEDDDCSIFQKLTRKCNCLNQYEYNDFVIHFNEETKYFTSITGEIIKNLRILKKFLYIGGSYTKHALMFLNEGLADSSYTEKVEIVTGCAHTDICNVFEDVSLVITCIAWPYKYDSYGDSVTQELAASYLNKLAQLEEGRRYLKYTSKITIDIKKVLKKKGAKLDTNTLELLHGTLDALHPQNMAENVGVTYYCRPGDEGFGSQTTRALIYYRRYMTSNEIFTHLDLLNRLSSEDKGKVELTTCLRPLVVLFKEMLMEYDDSEMNILVTSILNNIVSKKTLDLTPLPMPKMLTMADTSTEPIQKKNNSNQIPLPKKHKSKKHHRHRRIKSHLMGPSKVTSRQIVSQMNSFSTSHKYRESQVIVVPVEKEKRLH